jgi:hypothetical protein
MKKKKVDIDDNDTKCNIFLDDDKTIITSKKHKIKMNRIFREEVRSENIPFPEVDSLFEKIRSRVVQIINKFKK